MNTEQVKINERKVKVGAKDINLLSGEIHYWRLDPKNWRSIIKRVTQMGLDVVATYVCWEFHETSPGVYDFLGNSDPRRDLKNFLSILQDEGLWVILRPGPYIYSEWKNNGVPNSAAKYHRLHPEFQELALPYMKAVTEFALPYLATKGGPIILWQVDNEIDPWPQWYSEGLGIGNSPGLFQDFLEFQYEKIENLNSAWDTVYKNFEEAKPVSAFIPNDRNLINRYLDFIRFQHDYVVKVAKWTADKYRELGVNVPLYFNAYTGVSVQPWYELEKVGDLAGFDIYPTVEFSRYSNEQRTLFEAVNYARTFSKLPYIAEFESGVWHDRLKDVGVLPPNHYRLICYSALQSGIAGWNWYMLTDRDNWYQTPINQFGFTRPDLYETFSEIVSVYREINPPGLTKLTEIALTYDPLQRASVRPGQNLLQAFYEADVDYEFFDIEHGKTSKPFVFYAGGNWLSRNGQQRLLKYVQQGGHLFFIGEFPYMDDHMEPCNLLGFDRNFGVLKGVPQLGLELSNGTKINTPWIHTYQNIEGEPIIARRITPSGLTMEENSFQWELQNKNEYMIGYTRRIGEGKLTFIGLESSNDIIKAILDINDISIASRALDAQIKTTIFKDDDGYVLIATNTGTEQCATRVKLTPKLPKEEFILMDVKSKEERLIMDEIVVSVNAKDGAVYKIRRYADD